MDPGTLLATTHEAGDGLRVRLRLTRPSDRTRVQEFLDSLAPESREVVRDLTFYDSRRRLVVAATAPIGGRETVVGLADVELLETGLAQLGLVVDDDQQGQGVGKLLSEAAAALAAQQGATPLKAELAEDNGAVRRLMERLGPTVTSVEDEGLALYSRLPAGRRRAAWETMAGGPPRPPAPSSSRSAPSTDSGWVRCHRSPGRPCRPWWTTWPRC